MVSSKKMTFIPQPDPVAAIYCHTTARMMKMRTTTIGIADPEVSSAVYLAG
jgi:hypothetical protein